MIWIVLEFKIFVSVIFKFGMSEPKRSYENATPCKTQEQNKNLPSVRQGDWVCLSCNNLNFSFRTVCNRCKTQTRQANYFNFLAPSQPMQQPLGCYNTLSEMKKIPNTEFEGKYWPTEQKAKQQSGLLKSAKVFENALLLTPTKQQEKNPNPDEPYRSPFKLPSVSPLLKKFTDSLILERYSTANDSNRKSHCTRSHAKLIDFGQCSTAEVAEDENDGFDEQIGRFLENIEL